ncbi:MAG: type III-B CRISPR module RAMP protein Cmr4 [Rhodothalassiaceae bacterium]|nr:MAG: type III-B CRISPR module RAMP protein Cmr4 [Rhodothalassiaceae bacterium]
MTATTSGRLLVMLAETLVHPGVGQTVGAIDLPVMRERTTGHPVIAGSSLKGALRDAVQRKEGKPIADDLFGDQERAGRILVSDARLVLLPVRSLEMPYAWLTCPLLLERLARDAARLGFPLDLPDLAPDEGTALMSGEGSRDTSSANGARYLYLEERSFTVTDGGDAMKKLVETLGKLMPDDKAGARLKRQLVIVSDTDFKWFAENALPVIARNVLDEDTKTSKNLWYEEALPPDTLMVAALMERPGTGKGGALGQLEQVLKESGYLQVGGNETVGQGWFRTDLKGGGDRTAESREAAA